MPDTHEHCWHVADFQHAVLNHRDDVCCHCGASRCVSTAIMRRQDGHGPYASWALDAFNGKVPPPCSKCNGTGTVPAPARLDEWFDRIACPACDGKAGTP